MKKNLFMIPALVVGMVPLAFGQAQPVTKIGIIHMQQAIIQTKDGMKAVNDLKAKFSPRQQELEKKQQNIAQLQDQLRKGTATMSEDAKAKITRDIDTNTKSLNRDNEDLQADVEQEENKIYQELGSKLYAVVDKYAKDNGYTLIIDVSVPQQPVLWAADATNITSDIIVLYDKAHGGLGTSSPAPAAAPKAAPAPALAPKPAPAAPKK